ncbi:MAG TPA: molecular chaperone DnaK [Pseudohongiella sp.]|nr:molecular chaperone DnaK [Pseudohongiella sp.]HBX36239.1 molecular chaperone DnaK [Pseudohongiella sp.]|tara:strand:- start:28247 stop:28474 length:228 start_codon:yes stop_codon:yes gene_type:complete
MDTADHAQTVIEQRLADNLEAQRRKSQQSAGRESATECEECGAPIPELRRLASPGCRYCIACQQALETHQKQYNR